MSVTIDYYFMCSSPFAYLGHNLFQEIAARHGAQICYRPIDIMGVWAGSGSVPVGKRTPTRQRYRKIELQRCAEFRGMQINVDPMYFPVDPRLADRTVIALDLMGINPAGFAWRTHEGVWKNEQNIADPSTIEAYLEAEGHDAAAVLALAEGDDAAQILERNTYEATEADAIGAPVYVLNGEPFWGQDRLEYLDRALQSGRAPFRP